MKIFSKNALFMIFVFFNATVAKVQALGAVDNIASYTAKHADDIARVVIRNADDIARVGLVHVDDVIRVGVVHADDIARLSVFHADDIARLALRQGDDIIYDFSKIHLRTRALTSVIDNVDDIALKGISKADFINLHGKELFDDFSAYSSRQGRFINEAMRGNHILPRSGGGKVGSLYLKGDDYIRGVVQRGNRINDYVNTQTINQQTKLLRGDNLQADSLTRLYNIGDINGKSMQEVADMIKNNSHTLNNTTLTSTSLPTVNNHSLHSFSINGWGDANIGRANPYKIIRELDAPSGTKGFNMSQLSTARGQQEILLPIGLRTNVTDVRIDKILFEGMQYDVIRIFETIIP
jgi:hypothetical protein